jgi:ABC-type antimicrobial peptide transport system permease subunit
MRTITRTLKTASTALRRNVMRSALTCLGIIIGVAAVIAMMEIGQGSSAAIQKSIASMGANTLLVLPGTAASGGISWGSGSAMTLTPEDCDAILTNCPAVKNATPIERTRSTQIIYGNRNWIPQQIQGVTDAYLDIHDWPISDGESFTDRDVRNANKVCLIGQTLVRELFEGQSPIGKDIRIGNVTFRVMGVLAAKGASMMGQDQDDLVLAPWTTIKFRVSNQSSGGIAQSNSGGSAAGASSTSDTVNSLSALYPTAAPVLYPQMSAVQAADTPKPVRFANVDQILVSAKSGAQIPQAISQIVSLLHDRHHIHAGEPDDFQIRDMTELQKTMTSTTSLMSNLLLGVALISLIVGGVGIMNIMLVSVTERTREIGLRMAVGARGRDILRQFLIEAIILCLAGGAIGILLGRGGSVLVRVLLHWPTQISIPAIIASVAVSASVGLLFGYYPAWKASRLDPIEALRYE